MFSRILGMFRKADEACEISAFESDRYASHSELADGIFETARESFLEDGHLEPYSFLIKDRCYASPEDFHLESPEALAPKMMEIVRDLVATQADALLIITEAWTAPKAFHTNGSIADLPERGEAITLNFCSASGEEFIYAAFIERDGDKVSLGETLKQANASIGMFEPVRKAWELMAERGLLATGS